MIADKKKFSLGAGMLVAFTVVLVLIFMPLLEGGKNGLDYLDSLYNSISKGSAYYIPAVKEESAAFKGNTIEVTLTLEDDKQAAQAAQLFEKSGATATVAGAQLTVSGDLGQVLASCLDDADAMYNNDGKKVQARYGFEGRRALYTWWMAFKSMDKALKKQGKFKEAKIVATVTKKAVESSYNFYTIEPVKITGKLGMVIFSLTFYVLYTLLYGFAIMFLFEGWGMKLGH